MNMKIDANLIRLEREKRAWSQEYLASVTGLGVRTIQRIEATGSASYESVKALASALGISISDLSAVSEPLSSTGEAPAQSLQDFSLVSELVYPKKGETRKQMQQHTQVLPSIMLAGGILVGTAVGVMTPSALWWIGPLLFAFSIVGARVLDNGITTRGRMAGLGGAIGMALAFLLASTLIALADPAWVAMMLPILGGGAVAVLDEPMGCVRRSRSELSRT